ncbi:MAG: ImmA/IrrE family metallo-endopeptidase [Acidimicrobiia bacterium]|nr:ImmA/IrrE family metallo-endopeptidase [Acidimicrobiia bacterium]
MTEREVVEAFGTKVLAEIEKFLSAVLLKSRGAIEQALKMQRERLGVERGQLASAADVSVEAIEHAESDADRLTIHQLEHLAFVLGLDPAKLSVDEMAGADTDLGVRLRVLKRDELAPQDARVSPRTVLRFSEAASIILVQSRLQDWLEKPKEAAGFEPSDDYRHPTWRRGYDLAAHLRERLEIGLEPIHSMRELVEHRLGIPIVQVELPNNIAGATISTSGHRGIVLNTKGANTNVWIRRTTLAHELAHILFDPEQRLSNVRVDSYEQMERNTKDVTPSLDEVERRANAFAVEFLAPHEAVRQLVPDVTHVSGEAVGKVQSRFGIGRAAARFHVGNVWYQQADLPPESSIHATPTHEQQAAEDFTQSFFPIDVTTDRRRGRFALLTTEAFDEGMITADTAAQYLGCTEEKFLDSLPHLLQLL